MRQRDEQRFEMLWRVAMFGKRHQKHFPIGTVGEQLFAEVAAKVKTLEGAIARQPIGRTRVRGSMRAKVVARAALLAEFEASRVTARAVAKQRRDVSATFRQLRRPRDGQLIAIARQIAAEVAPNEAVLIAHHLRPTFLADLHRAITAFEQALAARVARRTVRMTAGTDIRLALNEGAAIVRQLDAVVSNVLGRIAAAYWREERRVRPSPGRPKRRKKARES